MDDSQFRVTLTIGVAGSLGYGFYELALAVGNFGIKGPLLILSAMAGVVVMATSFSEICKLTKKIFH